MNNSLSSSGNFNYWIIFFLNVLVECSVDLFGLLSGYLGYKKKIKKRRVLELIIIVEIYSVLIVAYMLGTHQVGILNIRELISGLVPSLTGKYWYITCYVALSLLMPYLNMLIENMSKQSYKNLCLSLIVFFSILPSFIANDIFGTEYGYSVGWLVICYFLGGYIGKYGLFFKVNKIFSYVFSLCFGD